MLAEYQARAVATAIYPREHAIAYPALGLIGELSEFQLAYIAAEPDYTEDLVKEAGDVCWYCANLCNDLGVELQSLSFRRGADLPSFMFVGQFCEQVKKYIRDGNKNKQEYILDFVEHVMSALASRLSEFCISLNTALTTNLEKLESRKERGTLQGDGDNR